MSIRGDEMERLFSKSLIDETITRTLYLGQVENFFSKNLKFNLVD
jgi:hypothetical protein